MQTYPEFNGLGISSTPGICRRCRTHRRATEPFILSTGMWIDMEGSIEFCVQCVEEMAHAVGLLTLKAAVDLRDQSEASKGMARAKGQESAALRKQVDALACQVEALNDEVGLLRGKKK